MVMVVAVEAIRLAGWQGIGGEEEAVAFVSLVVLLLFACVDGVDREALVYFQFLLSFCLLFSVKYRYRNAMFLYVAQSCHYR